MLTNTDFSHTTSLAEKKNEILFFWVKTAKNEQQICKEMKNILMLLLLLLLLLMLLFMLFLNVASKQLGKSYFYH